jgi:hypothetical protein
MGFLLGHAWPDRLPGGRSRFSQRGLASCQSRWARTVGPFGGGDAVDGGVAQVPSRGAGGCAGCRRAARPGARWRAGSACSAGRCASSTAMQSSVSKACASSSRLHWCSAALRCTLAAVPGAADLDARLAGVDVHVGRHADDAAVAASSTAKGSIGGLGACRPRRRSISARHALGRGHRGVPELPQLAVARGVAQAASCAVRQRHQPRVRRPQRDRLASRQAMLSGCGAA